MIKEYMYHEYNDACAANVMQWWNDQWIELLLSIRFQCTWNKPTCTYIYLKSIIKQCELQSIPLLL